MSEMRDNSSTSEDVDGLVNQLHARPVTSATGTRRHRALTEHRARVAFKSLLSDRLDAMH